MTHTISSAKVEAETEKAVCVSAPDFDEDMWVPKSQIDSDSEVFEEGTSGDLVVSDWFAEKKGWV